MINAQITKFINSLKGKDKDEGISENPFYICVDFNNLKSDLAMKMYQIKSQGQAQEWAEVEYDIDVDRSENICIESAQNQFVAGEGINFINNMNMTVTALKIFDEKITQLLKIIEQQPKFSNNLLVMRDLNQTINQISIQFYQSFNEELLE